MTPPPRVWLLHGARAGDNAQVTALGQALHWPYEIKRLRFHETKAKRRYWITGPSLETLDRAQSDPLVPPWPDLVIAVGRRSVPIGQWIKRQSQKPVRLVQIGRPNADLSLFDLVITTAQYSLRQRENILHLDWPLITLDRAKMKSEAEKWLPKIMHLPRPWIGLIIGGDATPYILDAPTAAGIAANASAKALSAGGALLVTTSPRTSAEAADAIARTLSAPAYFHRFAAGMENPYLAFLALADQLVVTAESVSMLTEACASGKAVETIELPVRTVTKRPLHSRLRRAWRARRHQRGDMALPPDLLDRLYDWVIDRGLTREPRNVTKFLKILYSQGYAVPFGKKADSAPPVAGKPRPDPFSEPTARIRAWFEKP